MKLRISVIAGLFVLCAAAQTATPSQAKRPAKDTETREIKLGEDEPGCKDSPLLSRIAGCSIIQCDAKDAQDLDIHVGISTDGVLQKESMDGPAEIIYYLCPSKVTLPVIIKQTESSLLKNGFKVVYAGKDDDDQPLVTMLKDTQWLQISTYMYNEYSAYVMTAIRVTPEASSEAMAEEMTKNGRVVLPGISFDKQKAELPSDVEKVLTEVVAFLVRQPELKIRVEGHCDDAADKQGNLTLSKERASAVASWLLEHGIDKSRISIDGIGDARPDASGEKARNQRIELVKI